MSLKRGFVFWLIITLVGCGQPVGKLTPSLATQLHRDIQAALDTFEITGAAFALVWPEGEYTAGFGVADVHTGEPITTDSRFAVASAIKPLAGAWIAARLDGGDLTWDTPLSALWPEVDLGTAGTVTLQQAVHQTSGFPRDDWAWLGRDLAVKDLASLVRQSSPILPVGHHFTYHNILFVLALRGVEAQTDSVFPIFTPTVTGHDRGLDGRLISLPMQSHQHRAMSVVLDAGVSASDAVNILRLLLADEGIFNAGTVLATGAACCPLGTMVRYGRGIFIEQYAGVTLWVHDGEGIGFSSAVMLDPVSKIGFFIMANRGNADEFIHAMRYLVIERAYGLAPSGVVAMQNHWEREKLTQQALINQAILPVESDGQFAGNYQPDMVLAWESQNGLTLHRGQFSWRLRALNTGQLIFDHGPLIGQFVDLVCANHQRRIVSGQSVLGIGDKC